MKKIVLIWIACVLVLVGLLAWLGTSIVPTPADTGERGLIDPRFQLQSATGPVSDTQLRGRYLLVYFGYTHCPDVCPTTLLLLQNVIAQRGAKGARVTPVFITVDPARDTPKIVGDYVAHFGAEMVGLSGTPAQIRSVADHYKVYYSKVEDKGSALGYTVDHSGFIYLVGPDGTYLTHFAANASEQALVEGLNRYVR